MRGFWLVVTPKCHTCTLPHTHTTTECQNDIEQQIQKELADADLRDVTINYFLTRYILLCLRPWLPAPRHCATHLNPYTHTYTYQTRRCVVCAVCAVCALSAAFTTTPSRKPLVASSRSSFDSWTPWRTCSTFLSMYVPLRILPLACACSPNQQWPGSRLGSELRRREGLSL